MSSPSRVPLNLAAGDWVRVRSESEIRDSLDEHGCTDLLPFMPEMLAFARRKFRVFKRAHKTCDTVHWTGLRELDNVVHLALLRCNGDSHGGCQAGCLLFWHEAWLERSSADEPNLVAPSKIGSPLSPEQHLAQVESFRRELVAHSSYPGHEENHFRCQATQLPEFTRALSWWRPGQYWRDIFYNRVSVFQVLWGLALSTYNTIQRRLNRPTFPNVRGKLNRTPSERTNLQPGEWVEVKSWPEIEATLDTHSKNRGMTFDPEMLPYCGRRFQVLRRVETIVEEKTGKIMKLPNPAIILEGSVCTAVFHRYCPRSAFPFWREIWLKRVENRDASSTPALETKDAASSDHQEIDRHTVA